MSEDLEMSVKNKNSFRSKEATYNFGRIFMQITKCWGSVVVKGVSVILTLHYIFYFSDI